MNSFFVEVVAKEACRSGRNSKAKAKRRRCAREYIMQSPTVCCGTCTTLCANYLDGVAFGIAVIDEAGQIPEVDTVAPLSRCVWDGIVVLVGGHVQLPCSV